jgi:hypothetical protein
MKPTFSPSEAALSIFTLAKRQPQFVLRYCILFALMVMVTFALGAVLGVGKVLQDYVGLFRGSTVPDQQALVDLLTPATGGITIMLVFSVITSAILTAMGLRKAVRDEDIGLFGLQFGSDEVRMGAAFLIFGAILVGVNVAVIVLGGLVSFGNAGLIALVGLASLVAMGLVSLRLSQFGVLTIANRRVAVGASWQETKGQALRLMGAYGLWLVVMLIFTGLAQAIGTLGAAAMGVRVNGMPATLGEMASAGWLFYALIYGLASGFANLSSLCIGAYAWHQMRGDLPVTSPTL